MLVYLLGRYGVLLKQLEDLQGPGAGSTGLPVGATAPAFSLADIHGETVTLDDLRDERKPIMLIFSDPNCGPCNELLPDVGRWQHDFAGNLTIAAVSSGSVDANQAKSTEYGLTRVLVQQDHEVSQLYQAQGTPSAVIVLPDGTIGTKLALGGGDIRDLVESTAGAPSDPA